MTIDQTRILIVEDESLIAAEIRSTLQLLGYHVVGVVMNGDRALDAITNLRPSLIFLDINVKGSQTGIDLAHIIRKRYSLPFLFLTALSDAETLAKARETMPYGYIVKPFNENTLKANIEMALFKYNKEQQRASLSKEYIEKRHRTSLSEREYGILTAFAKGSSYKKTADTLCISVNTVKTYQKKLYQRFNVHNKAALLQKLFNNP